MRPGAAVWYFIDGQAELLGLEEMRQVLTAAFIAAGLAAMGVQAGAEELRVPLSLTSFGAAQVISSYQMSAAGLALGPSQTFSTNPFAGSAEVMPVIYGSPLLPQSFAASTALNINVALDAGYNLDLAQRFDNYSGQMSPLLAQGNFLGLANGGHYAGITYEAAPNLRLRVGAQVKSNRLDSFIFDPVPGMNALPQTWNNGEQRSFLAGLSWDFSDWAGLNLSGISNSQKGDPIGFADLTPGATTNALNASAHVDFGSGWVTTAAFSEGLTQLDQKSGVASAIDSQSYSIAIAKRGLFGQDALGFSFTRPSPNLLDNNLTMVMGTGDLPPLIVAGNNVLGSTKETDLQLGYSTVIYGTVDLQANAAYQMNFQGQPGANSLAVLSRAKIKF